MLPPRILLGLGLILTAAGLAAAFATPLGTEAAVVGIPVGIAIILAALVGGGPRPVPASGYSFDGAMALLRRVSMATALVAIAVTGSAAVLWGMGEAQPADVLIVFALSLLTVYAAILTAAGIVIVTNRTAEEENDGGLPPT